MVSTTVSQNALKWVLASLSLDGVQLIWPRLLLRLQFNAVHGSPTLPTSEAGFALGRVHLSQWLVRQWWWPQHSHLWLRGLVPPLLRLLSRLQSNSLQGWPANMPRVTTPLYELLSMQTHCGQCFQPSDHPLPASTNLEPVIINLWQLLSKKSRNHTRIETISATPTARSLGLEKGWGRSRSDGLGLPFPKMVLNSKIGRQGAVLDRDEN